MINDLLIANILIQHVYWLTTRKDIAIFWPSDFTYDLCVLKGHLC